MADDETQNIRGGELAEDAGAAVTPVPDEALSPDGIRGDGLADDAQERPAPPEGELGEDGLRGDGLADGA